MRPIPLGLVPLSLAVGMASAYAIVPMSREDIIDKAATGPGSPYWWGHSCWRSWDESWGGADCSGFVARVWNVPIEVATDYSCTYHPYSTYNFKYESTHWSSIARSALDMGDSMVRRVGDSGHIAIYASGDPWGCQELYEAQCTACGIRHQVRCLDSSYYARERDALDECTPTSETCNGVDDDCDGDVDEGVCHDAELVSDTVPAELVACGTYDVSVTMRNTGTSTWTDGAGFHLRYVVGDLDAPATLALPEAVSPAESVTFAFAVTVGSLEGAFDAIWRMEKGSGRFGEAFHPTVGVLPPPFRSEVIDGSYPQLLRPGEVGEAWFLVKNSGTEAWPAHTVAVGTVPPGVRSPLWTETWNAFDVPVVIGEDVAPGEIVRIAFQVGCEEGTEGPMSGALELRDPEGDAFYCGGSGLALGITAAPERDPAGASEEAAPGEDAPGPAAGCAVAAPGRASPATGALLVLSCVALALGWRRRTRRRSAQVAAGPVAR